MPMDWKDYSRLAHLSTIKNLARLELIKFRDYADKGFLKLFFRKNNENKSLLKACWESDCKEYRVKLPALVAFEPNYHIEPNRSIIEHIKS